MQGLGRHFGVSLVASLVVAITALAVAGSLAVRCRAEGPPAIARAARVLAVASLLLILSATALPHGWPPRWHGFGDLVLGIGQGGLSDLHVLTDWPRSLAALLLLANVGIYVPLGFFIALGWRSRMRAAVVVAVALAVTVESIQFLLLDRIASTDDVLLNTAGAAVGFVIGRGLRVRFHQHRDTGPEDSVRR